MGLFTRNPKRTDALPGSDEELFARYLHEGEPAIIGELFRRYTHLVMGVCMKYLKNEDDAKDAVMEIFEQLLLRPPEKEVLLFRNWLFTVARNHCLMQLRKGKHFEKHAEMKSLDFISDLMESPGQQHLIDEAEYEIVMTRLHEAMAMLSPGQRQCIRMFFMEDRSYKYICEATGYSFMEVKSHIQNGKRNLKNMMDHGQQQE